MSHATRRRRRTPAVSCGLLHGGSVVVDVMLVGRRAQHRWALAAALGLAPGAACDPELALSRLTHPASTAPEVVVLLVEDGVDLAWLRRHVGRDTGIPVVAAVARPTLAGAARAAGAAEVLDLEASTLEYRRAVHRATAPAVVIDLDAVRTA